MLVGNDVAIAPEGPEWIAYTPVIGNGWTLGSGTLTGKYTRRGDLYGVSVQFTVGNGTIGASIPTFTLPVSAITGTLIYSHALLDDVGVGSFIGLATVNTAGIGTNVMAFLAVLTNSTYSSSTAVTSTVPFTWGSGDRMLSSVLWFEAA